MQNPSEPAQSKPFPPAPKVPFPRQHIKWPGLTAGAREIGRLLDQLPRRWAVNAYKHGRELLWVVFVGGTGTGKSTIYNALCGKELSESGVERPKTFGPIVYAHRDAPIEADFPFDSMRIKFLSAAGQVFSPREGAPGELTVLQHARADLAHLALADTPDVDSLEVRNREIVEDLYLLADVVVFVTSLEKYADDVPFQFLKRIYRDGKVCFLVLNKARDLLTSEEAAASFRDLGVDLALNSLWVFPHQPSRPAEKLRADGQFNSFMTAFFAELGRDKAPPLVQNERVRRIKGLQEQTRRLADLLRHEQRAAKSWTERLETLFRTVCADLFQQQERHFDEESRGYLQEEVRRLFGKYDVLGGPRRFVAQIMLAPLRMLGLQSDKSRLSHAEALLRIREKIDMAPIQAAVEKFNRSVLESLSPADEQSPLYRLLRQPEMRMGESEVKAQVWQEQDKLVLWLESTFRQLAAGIPKSRQWGIYSTSILWGAMILSFEVAIGGGISLLEAVLDSALAPFVTKGAVELFAYQELQKIARELADRYQNGVRSVLGLQRDRYRNALQSLTTEPRLIAELDALQSSFD